MLRLAWRLVVLVWLALAVGAGWVWYRSHARSEAVWTYGVTKYFQAISQRGRVMVLWVDNYPAPKEGEPVRGYAAEAWDSSGKWLKGAGEFYLRPAGEKSKGPLRFSDGVIEALPEGKGAAPSQNEYERQLRTPVMPPVPAAPSTESEIRSKLTLSKDIEKSPSAKGATSLPEPPALTLGAPLKPAPGPEKSPLTLSPDVNISHGEAGPLRSGASVVIRGSGSSLTMSGPQVTGVLTLGGGKWPTYNYHAVSAPHWLLVAVFSIPPMVSAAGAWRRGRLRVYRQRVGLCVRCGYDLRGNLEPRCPECGRRTGRD